MANLLGIEISPDAVRGVLIRTSLRNKQIARFEEVPILPPSAPEPAPAPMLAPVSEAFPGTEPAPPPPSEPEAPAEPPDPIRVALEELVRRMSPPRPSIVAALPGEEASMRRIELPAAVAKKIDELLPIEMEALVPFDADETLLDHQTIEVENGKLHALVVAVPKTRIRGYLDQLAAWRVDPIELAVGAAALDGLAQVVPALATEGPHVIVHLGARRTDVCILRHGTTALARTISAGVDDAGDAAFATSGGAGSAFSGSLAERLARELRQTLAAWRMQGGAPPVAIHVSGHRVHDERVPQWIGAVLGQPVELLAIPDTQPVPTGIEPVVRARYALALALAARGLGKAKRLDLRKGEFVARRTTGVVRQHAPLFAACAAAIVCAFLFSTYARWSVLDSRREALEAQLAQVTRDRLGEETRSTTRARTLLESGGSRSDPMPRFTAYDALAAISAAIPTDVTHDVQRLHIDLGDDRSGGHFELAGIVRSIEDRDRIAQALGQVECFRELELGPLTQAPNDRRLYRVEADILCPGDEPAGGGPTKRGRSGRSRAAEGEQ
ncbi:type IV pilus biogenesis protein PilM [Sandaracinus amylolyticus]|uniref:General secretion pathway protein L n=1 Tax=Sandaracinus amylolyticus TaxID=927083 RepID=A0A0F6YFR7_9BACT|nr:pilus assembly protein PilM [Sandaracinus amylolyticus]AKF03922.1 General secretion pathway protein L [Sandaracinus amylolyticus]